MDFFEDIDEDFGDHLGVGDVINMLEKSHPRSKKRKKNKSPKFIVFEDEIDEDEYTFLKEQIDDEIASPSDSHDPDYVNIALEVGEATRNIFRNEPLEELSKEITHKCELKSSKGKKNIPGPSSTNQKNTNSVVSNDTSKKTSRGTSKASNLSKSSSASINDAGAGSKTAASGSSANSSKSSASKSASTKKNLEKCASSSSTSKDIKPGKSSSSKSGSKRKKREVYVPGSYNNEFKFKAGDFPALR